MEKIEEKEGELLLEELTALPTEELMLEYADVFEHTLLYENE